jgi:phosphoribosylformylglycinamidine synthase
MTGRPHRAQSDLAEADLEAALAHGLSAGEYERIVAGLGRRPRRAELGVFAVMWSEHCSYKSSRVHLGKLPGAGARVINAQGENAGAIDVGDGWAAVFKIESHNHPSFVEPYQGAATGVGGIIRDILAMGARPTATLNSLKFGAPQHPRTAYLTRGVVAGIGGYGNCVGVPTVGGETSFDPAYDANILVNVFCLGLAPASRLASARARGPGNPVLYVGSATGRDGIHGASLLASAAFTADGQDKRPTVQVGDPFTEKLLIEACLEALESGAVVAIQDMGAAGLTSSSAEMAARGGLGIELDLDRVPLRQAGLSAYEILLSESQERMLLVVERGREKEVAAIFARWELACAVIGRVTEDRRWRVWLGGAEVANIPVELLTSEAPRYERTARPPLPDNKAASAGRGGEQGFERRAPTSVEQALTALVARPNVGSKRWIFRQYDSLVMSNTVVGPGSDAAVIRLKGTGRGLALVVDSNSRACWLDPYLGAVFTVIEAARNLACAGARPVGLTDCLNYGSPESPAVMWQFVRAVEGIRDAALALGLPVVSGNVSFYNETAGQPIPPTPTIGAVGVLEDVSTRLTQVFKRPGDLVALLRTGRPSLAASEYAAVFGAVRPPEPPRGSDADEPRGRQEAADTCVLPSPVLAREKRLLETLVVLAERRLIESAHDLSDGGLAVAVLEACLNPEGFLGAEFELPEAEAGWQRELFGEGPSTVVVSLRPGREREVAELAGAAALEFRLAGKVSEQPRLRLAGLADLDVDELAHRYQQAVEAALDGYGR